MGIFNLFKKRKEIDTAGVPRKQGMFYKGQEVVSEKLTFSEIENWIENKTKENKVKEKEILVLVKNKIIDFNTDLREKIIILDEFDVKSKKADDKIKEIVIDSRTQYIEEVYNLLINLEDLKETEFSNLTQKIDKIFFDFNKASFKNYERATILIGKEMANIKTRFKNFSKDLLEIFNNNKEISELFQNIESIKSKLNSLNNFKENELVINKTIESVNEKINENENENQRLLQEIGNIEQSSEYRERLETQKKIKSLSEELNRRISELKQLLDFKAMANFFHINPEQMKILKDHKENFQIYFKKDNGANIRSLLDEANMNNNVVLEKTSEIKSKIEETENHKRNIKVDKTQELHPFVKNIETIIDSLKIEKVKEEKRNKNLVIDKENLIESLRQKLEMVGVEVY
jgi:Fe-S-cluster formation regulator IscX/YfhJ